MGDKNLQNPGQNPNTKIPQQGQQRQDAGRQQQGFDKNRNQQNPQQGNQTASTNTDLDETEEVSEKEDLYGNRKDAGNKQDQHH
jgi:hypothetical protein